MTRSSDLVMVPREITLEMQKAYFDVIDRNMDRVVNDCAFGRFANNREAYRAMIAAALQSVEGGVQGSIATKQESRPESAPRTETATVTALRECQRVLAMMIDPASIKSTSAIHAFAAATAAEAKARAALSGVTNSAPASRASHNSGERDPVVMPDCPGADTTSDGGEPMPERTQARLAGSDDGLGPMQAIPRTPGDCSGPSDTQLTKTPSANHDAGNLPDDPDMPSLRLCSFNYLADELRRRGATVTPAPHGGDFANG